jgi:4-hydroxy-tetrahydrodipicolinate synthase
MALPGKLVIAGVNDAAMLQDAESGGADAVLAFPAAADPVRYHEAMSRELPAILFWLYERAGGVAYDDVTLHRLLDLPNVIGIKIATLDSVMTFQRLAALVRQHPGKLVITGEDRFLGYSIMCGADCALIGLAAALPALSCGLFQARSTEEASRFLELSGICDRFAAVTFREPMEGYVRRMLWAAAAEGRFAPDACDDPWGPPLPSSERNDVLEAVRHARSALARL